jgi:haloalkane dehalogenase
MHYLDEGTGAPLLMLHGNPTWSFYYRNLVLGFRDRYRCIAPDHIGCGLSDKPQHWSYRIPAHTDNVCELLAKLDLQEVTLVAHDWGGPIGYLAALRFPGRFKRFVTFNTAVFLLPLPKLLTMMRIPLYGPLLIRGLNGLLRAGLWTSVANRDRFTRSVRAGYLAPYDTWAHRVAILRFVQEIPLEDGHPNRRLLADLERQLHVLKERPHLVIWGLRDPVFHREYLAGWRQRFPAAEVHAFEDASHWVVDEAHERILDLMREFLSRTE